MRPQRPETAASARTAGSAGRTANGGQSPHVGLFVTCLVDLMRPSVGFAAVKLLEEAGCRVSVPRTQTCCGQPAYNSGDCAEAARIARQVVEAFEPFDYVVAPSGSCAGMLKRHYPALLAGGAIAPERVAAFAAKVHELTAFLVDVLGVERINARHDGRVTYHDSCSCLRELGIREQPRRLLRSIKGLELVELARPEECCGFGGLFSVKYGAISNAIVARKAADITATGAPLVLAGDLGCLLNIKGKLRREGRAVSVRHIAEVLAGMTDAPAIGEE